MIISLILGLSSQELEIETFYEAEILVYRLRV